MGFAYIVSVVSLFDEYVNDLLYLREGSCLPRCYQIFFTMLYFFYRAYRLLLLKKITSNTHYVTFSFLILYYKVKFVWVHLIHVVLILKVDGPT